MRKLFAILLALSLLMCMAACRDKNGENGPTKASTAAHVHKYEQGVVLPGCFEKGYTVHRCACGDSYTSNYVEPVGHTFLGGICLDCGLQDQQGHSLTDGCWYYLYDNGVGENLLVVTFDQQGGCKIVIWEDVQICADPGQYGGEVKDLITLNGVSYVASWTSRQELKGSYKAVEDAVEMVISKTNQVIWEMQDEDHYFVAYGMENASSQTAYLRTGSMLTWSMRLAEN